MEDLTPRQRQVLMFIQDSLAEQGLPPTRAEIAEALGFKSANAAEDICVPCSAKASSNCVPGLPAAFNSRIPCVTRSACR